jgi:hypothetical protein
MMRDTQQRRSATAAAPTAAAPTAAGCIWNPVWRLTWQVIFSGLYKLGSYIFISILSPVFCLANSKKNEKA